MFPLEKWVDFSRLGKLGILLVAECRGRWVPLCLLMLGSPMGSAMPGDPVLFWYVFVRMDSGVPMLDQLSQPGAGRFPQQWTLPLGSTTVPHFVCSQTLLEFECLLSPSLHHGVDFNKFGRKGAVTPAAAACGSAGPLPGSCGCMGSASPMEQLSVSVSATCLVSHPHWRLEFAWPGM